MCRECFSEYNRKRYEVKRDEIVTAVRARYWADPDKVRAEGRRSRERHIEDRRAYAREYQRTHDRHEYKVEWARQDRAKNPEKWRAKDAAWRLKNPEAAFARDSRRLARKRAQSIAPTPTFLMRAKWDYWGGLCWICGGPACEWDHVKPISRGGPHCLANLRPACRRCNATKRNEWPLPQKEC